MAGLTGAVLALGGGAAVAVFAFGLTPVLPWAPLAGTAGGLVALTVATGLVAQRGVSKRPPLEVLRAEG